LLPEVSFLDYSNLAGMPKQKAEQLQKPMLFAARLRDFTEIMLASSKGWTESYSEL